jgi:hypothetical protein
MESPKTVSLESFETKVKGQVRGDIMAGLDFGFEANNSKISPNNHKIHRH